MFSVVEPAPRPAALELAGGAPRLRRLMLYQVRSGPSLAIYRAGAPVCVVMFGRDGWRRLEMGLAIDPAAAPHMRRLVRFAQLTLAGIAQDRLVVAYVDPANAAGQRMAALSGFRPDDITGNPHRWIFGRRLHDTDPRRRERRREAPGAEIAGSPADRQ